MARKAKKFVPTNPDYSYPHLFVWLKFDHYSKELKKKPEVLVERCWKNEHSGYRRVRVCEQFGILEALITNPDSVLREAFEVVESQGCKWLAIKVDLNDKEYTLKLVCATRDDNPIWTRKGGFINDKQAEA